jgi:hypothetical protein
MKLEHSEQFKKDLLKYRAAVNRMSTAALKGRLEYLIQNLLSEIRYLDSQHDELNVSKTLPSTIVDSRSKISDIRSQIENLIK